MRNSMCEVKGETARTPSRLSSHGKLRFLVGMFVAFFALTAMPVIATLTINSPADQAAYCLGDTIEAGGITVYSDCGSERSGVAANVGQISVSMGGSSPDYSSTSAVVLDESGWITVSASDDCGCSDSLDIAVVEFVSMAVSSPATSVGGGNFAVLKQPGSVLVIVELIPGIPASGTDVAGNMIIWSVSGYQDTVSPRIKAVPTTAPLEATVAAFCCNGGDAKKVWVIWATVTPRFSDDKSSGNSSSFPSWCSGDALGPWSDIGTPPPPAIVGNKVELVGQILPSGAGAVVSSGWAFTQDVSMRTWHNSISSYTDSPSTADAWDANFEDNVPDSNDQIFLIDNPTDRSLSGTQFFKALWHFQTRVEWNSQTASDDALWNARVKAHPSGGTYVVDECSADIGNPAFDTSY